MTLPDDAGIERLALRLVDRSLPKQEWTHAGHFAAALWLCRHRRDLTAPDGIRTLITRHNEATNTPNTDTGGYHYTITLASMGAAADRLAGCTPGTPLHAVLASLMASRLGHPGWLLAHWSREKLFGVAARREWVAPDLEPLSFQTPCGPGLPAGDRRADAAWPRTTGPDQGVPSRRTSAARRGCEGSGRAGSRSAGTGGAGARTMAARLNPGRAMMLCLGATLLPAVASAQHPQAGDPPSPPPAPWAGERVLDLPLRSGDRQRVLLSGPAHARGTIVMFPGATGDVGLERDGDIRHGDNFVVRTRALWSRHGYAVLIPDTIDRVSLRGVRSSPAYAWLVGDLVGFAHGQVPGPVFLLGTSQGAIAAMNGAAHAAPGSIAGVVLTESVSVMGGSGETVFDADPQRVRAPALVVANRDDRCDVAPPQAAPRIAAAMTGSRDVRVLMVSGGVTRSAKACGSLTPHGYYGIEGQVVDAISRWMETHD